MNLSGKMLATLIVPIVVLLGGAGIGLVVAAEKSYSPPSGADAFAAAPTSLVLAESPGRAAGSKAGSSRNKVAALKRKCKKKRGAAKRNCLKRVQALTKARYMSVRRAESLAERAAEKIWESNAGDYEWTDYGVSDCRRLTRSSVSCAVYVYYEQEEYGYDDYGSTYDCEWVVNSRYLRGGKLKVTSGFARRSCEWL